MRFGRKSRQRQSGFALMMVLWALALIALLVTHMTSTSRVEAKIAFNLREDEAVQSRLDGAVFETAFHVLAQGGQHWEPDGRWRALGSGGQRIAVRATDPGALVNLNTATPDLLRALLREVAGAGAEAVADEIIAWREKGDQADSEPGPLKLQRYAAAGRRYGPPEAPFRSVDELGMVLGVTPEMLSRLKPHLTVYSDYGPVRDTPDVTVRKALLRVMDEGGELPDDQSYERERILAITAVVPGSGTARAARQAVLRFSLADRNRPCVILAWNRVYADEISQD